MAALSLPWSLGAVERPNGEPVTDTAVIFLADSGMIEVEETENASPIAQLILAAPDLLAALKPFAEPHAMGDNYVSFAPRLLEAARSAIAKAEGRS